MDSPLVDAALRGARIGDLGIAKSCDHAHIVVLRKPEERANVRHERENVQGKGHHDGTEPARGAEQLEVGAGDDDVLHGLAVAKRGVGDEDVRRAAEEHVGAHRLLPALEVAVALLVVAFWVDALVRQTLHFGAGEGPEATEDYLRRADVVCPVAAVQNRYSMLARWHEPLFPVLEELDVALVAFSPMANGFLSGKYNPSTTFEGAQDFRDGMPQYTEEGYEKDRAVLDLIGEIADERGATMAQVSLAWMLCKKSWIVPIPGSRKPERLRENLGAADIELAADEVESIDAALDGMDPAVFGGHAAA